MKALYKTRKAPSPSSREMGLCLLCRLRVSLIDFWLSLRVSDPVEDPEALEGSVVEGLYAPCCSLQGMWGFVF